MAHETPDHNMEMPTRCQKCGGWFDLNDGVGSTKWYPNTVICEECGEEEDKEIEQDERVEELKSEITDLEWNIDDDKKRLEELKEEFQKLDPEAYNEWHT